ncbi:MAG: TonB-dependent receptor plug domain-containing protein, partial [Gemmatimonadota bacterium]
MLRPRALDLQRFGRVVAPFTLAALLMLPAPMKGQDRSRKAATQESLARAQAALDSCLAATSRLDTPRSVTAADRAERLYEEAGGSPALRPEALRGWARVLTGCRIPLVDDMDRLSYLDRATNMLEEALELSPGYWPARFSLAMTDFSAPPFLGLTGEAIEHFQRLIAEGGQGIESVLPEVYLHLGEALLRAGRREEAMESWREGLKRFPDDPALAGKVAGGERDRLDPSDSTPAGVGPEGAYEMEPITVQAGSFALGDPRAGIPVTRTQVYNTPGGTADVLQAFQTMPGVTRLGEGSDLYVRGGDASETAVFIDGLRVHEAGMFERLDGSLFGILDPAVLRRAYFSSGGFSVRYGDALSGVLDAETEGIPPVESWRAGVNVVSLGGTLRRHLGNRAGVWASATATDVRGLLALQGREEEYPNAPRAG